MSIEQDYLEITKGPRTGEKIILSGRAVTIGRVKPADAVINVESISRTHARILPVDSAYSIEDLGSSNGTFVNGERIKSPRKLSNGDVINLGAEVELRLVAPAAVPGANATMMDINPDASNKTFVVADSPDAANKTMMVQGQAPVGDDKTAMMAPVASP